MRNQSKFRPAYHHFFLLNASLVILTVLLAGTYYDSSDDAIINLLIQGKAGGYSITNYPRFYYFISDALKCLYDFFPSIPWQGVLLTGFLILAYTEASVLLFRTWKVLFRDMVLFLLLFYSTIGIEHVMFFNMNRFAIILSGIGFFALFYGVIWKDKGFFLRGLVIVLLGMFIRPNGGLMAIVIFLPGSILLWYIYSPVQSRATLLKASSVVVAVFCAVYTLLNFSESVDDQSYKYRNYLKSNIVDFGIYEEPETSSDSLLKFEAIHEGYIADTIITNSFLESVTSDQRVSISGFRKGKAGDAFITLVVKLFWDYAAITFCLGLLFLGSWRQLSRKGRIMSLAYNLLIILLLWLVGYTLKIPDKILGPSLYLLTVTNLVVLGPFVKYSNPKVRGVVWIGLYLFLIAYSVKLIHRTSSASEIQFRKRLVMQEWEKELKGKKIITAKYNNVLLYSNPFWSYDYEYMNNFINTSGWITILPEYKSLFENATGSPSWVGVFQYAKSHSDECVFVYFNAETAHFLENYLNRFHNMDVNFLPIEFTTNSKIKQYHYEIR